MSDFDDGRADQADNPAGEPESEIESLTSAFQEPVPSPLDDLPPASYWPDGAVPERRPRIDEPTDDGASSPVSEPDFAADRALRQPEQAQAPEAPVVAPDGDTASDSALDSSLYSSLDGPLDQPLDRAPGSTSGSASVAGPNGALGQGPGAGPIPPYRPPPPRFAGGQTQSGNRSLWIAIAVIGALVVALGGCGYLLFAAVDQPPIDRVNELMADVVDADFAGAARNVSTSDDCFGTDAEAGLEALFVPNPVDGYDFTFVSVEDGADQQATAVVEGSIDFRTGGESLPEGGSRPARMILVESVDDWRVCGIFVE